MRKLQEKHFLDVMLHGFFQMCWVGDFLWTETTMTNFYLDVSVWVQYLQSHSSQQSLDSLSADQI